ncbi:efflux RND transporter periplasmic adaptor subunit [Limnoglobus roseus]|uniref:Efflux RND transporter periplasmic adaptor subunit n=1 Tax=Limnoglobus roseus TaxID=2598579 RepID=A0A5C1ACB1_9BACT|nr:efflux RND transporter periplasmic adaptor subunit [Limnoglobus roseus]QEL16235.1 efflux RND transporter periplasmic adaptor subunit [Limnoglobus roseus]
MTTLTPIPADRSSPPRRRWRIAGASVVAILGLGAASQAALGLREPQQPTSQVAPTDRTVTVVSPTAMPVTTDLLLPAQLLPYEQTNLHARIDGYVAKWHVDRGARVKAGQLLAEIAAPEVDQQTKQAEAAVEQGRALLVQRRADLEQAKAELDAAKAQVKVAEANREYAASEDKRQTALGTAVSRTESEVAARNRDATAAQVLAANADVGAKEKLIVSRVAAIGTQEATVRGLEADARRLKEVQGFKRIVAPFDGTVTRRFAEVGMLLSTVTPQPLFHVQNSATLRVQVDVPQGYATGAKAAKVGYVIVPESPNHPLAATVARTANALDPTTRTLRVELELPNESRTVLAGTYAQVRIALAPSHTSQMVPVSALRYTPQGVEVIVVEGDKPFVRPVKLGRDYGRTVEVVSGLSGGEQLVVNPADDLAGGQTVRIQGTTKPAEPTTLAETWPSGHSTRR